MSKRFSILVIILVIVSGLVGGAITGRIFTPKVAVTENPNQRFEYGEFSVNTWLKVFPEGVAEGNVPETVSCYWQTGSKSFSTGEMKFFITPDGMNKLLKEMGINRDAPKGIDLIIYFFDVLGEQGWELVLYEKENSLLSVASMTESYLFKRQK